MLNDGKDYDNFTLATGWCVIILGVTGLFLNVSTFVFFVKYDHRGEKHRKRFRTVLINLSTVDILLSLAAALIRGPGFIWPDIIYGSSSNTTSFSSSSSSSSSSARCTVLSVLSSWLLSDLNTLALLPISCICVFLPSVRQIRGIIAIVWLLPAIEVVILILGLELNYLTSRYTPSFHKCSIHPVPAENSQFNWERFVDVFNMLVFNILPLMIHIGIWVSLCWREPHMTRGKRLSGALVVLTALITWLPYGVVYGILRYDTVDEKSLVYIFFYISIVTNPIIYGFLMYRWGIFREGCCQMCWEREVMSRDGGGQEGTSRGLPREPSFTKVETGSATMTTMAANATENV